MTSFTIIPQADCGKRIARIKRIGASLQAEIHLVACSTLAHIRDHGDYTLAVQLLDALPNGQRVKSLAYWYNRFSDGAAIFTQKSGEGWACKLSKTRTAEMFDVDAAYETSFADLTSEKNPVTMTVPQVLAYLKRKADDDAANADGSPRIAPEARELFAALWVAGSKAVNAPKVVKTPAPAASVEPIEQAA